MTALISNSAFAFGRNRSEGPMRITIVTGPFLPTPPASYGAIEIRWIAEADDFVSRGHEVNFVSRRWPGLADDETVGGVRHIRRSGFSRTGRIYFDLIKDFFYALRILFALPRADVLLTNTFWLPVLARLRPSAGKVVVSVNRWPKRQMILYSGAARLACVSQAVAAEVARQAPSLADRVVITPNPVDLQAFVPPPSRLRRIDDRIVVFYHGRIHPEKGVTLLAAAASALQPKYPNLVLRLVGPTAVRSGGGGDEYAQKVREAAGQAQIEFVPPVSNRAELAALLQSAHVYCYPSLADKGEALPCAPLEAMATGLVPIVSNLPQFRDYIFDGLTGLFFDHVSPRAANHLAEQIDRLISDPEKLSRMSELAVRTAQAFSVKNICEIDLSVFENVLETDPARRKPVLQIQTPELV